MTDWSEDQQRALDAIEDWRARKQKPYLTLGGYAGTGKSTLLSHMAQEWKNVATVALAGKAAHVLRSKGVEAQTLHSLIYLPPKKGQRGAGLHFRKREFLSGVSAIFCDEASMIDHVLKEDVLSFKVPVLFCGDHGQLEPIGRNPRLMVNPEVRLERIHRQAANNPILRLATAFREGRHVPYWEDPAGRLSIRPASAFRKLVSPDVQIICGFNKTRHAVNQRVRDILGFKGTVAVGEKLICLRNNALFDIFNGQQMTVLDVLYEDLETVAVRVKTDDDQDVTLPCFKPQFGVDTLQDFRRKDVALCDYGYAITAHKAQGTELPAVLVLEEISSSWDARRWRYTVATRARERLVYCA